VLDGAEPLAGPAARPLPQLPVEIGPDGELRARGDFSGPAGPEFWELR
jgi:ubiquinol-cytochrome c reductase iron-sulfur subunit